MIAGNMFSPIVAFAEDVGTDSTAQEQQSTPVPETSAPETIAPETAAPPQTEAPDYTITLTDQDAFGLKYDQTQFLSQDKDRKTTTLKYKQGEEVDLDITVNDGYQIDKITFQDTDIGMEEYEAANGLVYGFTWKDEDTLTFNMPAVNLFMKSAWHQLQTETTVRLTHRRQMQHNRMLHHTRHRLHQRVPCRQMGLMQGSPRLQRLRHRRVRPRPRIRPQSLNRTDSLHRAQSSCLMKSLSGLM